jgi:hypothetical protein
MWSDASSVAQPRCRSSTWVAAAVPRARAGRASGVAAFHRFVSLDMRSLPFAHAARKLSKAS